MSFSQDSPAFFAFCILGLRPYSWQAEAIQAAARPHSRLALVAANGSGKTACVNVVLLLWFLWKHPRGIAMVTSGSWNQLKTQLWPNLEMFRSTFPSWQWQADRIKTPEGGFIAAYSTDRPGRAEGHHEHLPERPVMLMVDEAKSVPEVIFEALSRCTPTYFILTSSPGAPSGTFYSAFNSTRALYHTVRATAFDCPHILPEKIAYAQALYGPNYNEHPIYRSMILAEFTEGTDNLIIPRELINRALENKPAPRHGYTYAGIDWAAGGDETVLATRTGNQLRILYANREKDTTRSAEIIVGQCRRLGIPQDYAYGDQGGLGKAILDHVARVHKYRMRAFNGGLPSSEPKNYKNTNAEAWLYFRLALERGEVCFPDGLSEQEINQFTNRYLLYADNGSLRCESKSEMAERGVSSPDRADAFIMAWWAGRHMQYFAPDTAPPTVQRFIKRDFASRIV